MSDIEKPNVTGIVEARVCETCGHHELGILVDDKWVSIRPGMRITIHKAGKETPGGQ